MFPEFSGIIRDFSRQTGITDPGVDNWVRETYGCPAIRHLLCREYYFTRPENEGYWVRYPADRVTLKNMYYAWWKPEMFSRQLRFQEFHEYPPGEWQYDPKTHGWFIPFIIDRRVMPERDAYRYYQFMSKYYTDLQMELKKLPDQDGFKERLLGTWDKS